MSSDPFSDLLAVMNAETVVSGGFTAGGSWLVRFPVPRKLKFFGVVRGRCWLRVDGESAPVELVEGDVFLLSAQRGFVVASDLNAKPQDASEIFTPGSGAVEHLGGEKESFLIGGHVQLDAATGALLTDVLPPLILARAATPQAPVLQWLLDQLVKERTSSLPGSVFASSQLAQLMFVQLLRVHIASTATLPPGLLRAVSDARIAPAVRLMHTEPGRPWRIEELAKAAAMSRTTFAIHFKEIAGVAPLAYLTEWRMHLAARALRDDDVSVAALASTLGYASESAFSNAFKRVTGSAPAHYRRASLSDRPALVAVRAS